MLVGMVKVRVRSWVMHDAYESPHKDRKEEVQGCVCLLLNTVYHNEVFGVDRSLQRDTSTLNRRHALGHTHEETQVHTHTGTYMQTNTRVHAHTGLFE